MVLIALAFVGLAAFIGLAVDAGILYTDIGHLRRAVDAAALAAANQYRRDVPPDQLEHAAQELLQLNNLDSASAQVKICDWDGSYPSYMDVTLCPDGFPTPTTRYRKKVRVDASMPVKFAFLPIIGITQITIHQNAVGETAALDLVLVIDESESMAYNAPPGDPMREPDTCNPGDNCYPFHDVRDAANTFVQKMYFPFDRVSVVTFAQYANTVTSLTGNEATVQAAINSMSVQNLPGKDPTDQPCYDQWFTLGDPSGCESTAIADGLYNARAELSNHGDNEAVWVVVLLTDGAANQAANHNPGHSGEWYCPGTENNRTWDPNFALCRDDVFGPLGAGDNSGQFGFDAEDAARAEAFQVGCRANGDPAQSSFCNTRGIDGIGAVMFTIGLGDKVYSDEQGLPAGERLLRQIANIGDDGDWSSSTDPCNGVPYSDATHDRSCGDYYFSRSGGGLGPIFDDIAKRIFTRLSE
jgi:hypothetical protein